MSGKQSTSSTNTAALPRSLQLLLQKQQEYAALQALKEASGELVGRVEKLSEMTNVMADGGEGGYGRRGSGRGASPCTRVWLLLSAFSRWASCQTKTVINVPAVAKVLQNWAYVFSVLGSLDMTRGEEGEPVPQMIRLPHPEAEAAAAEEEAAAAAAAAVQGRQ